MIASSHSAWTKPISATLRTGSSGRIAGYGLPTPQAGAEVVHKVPVVASRSPP